jgi:hypothetical protein
MAMTLMVQSYQFLSLWMGADFAEKAANLLVIHTITFGFVAIQIVSWQMTEGLGFPNYNFKIFAICLVLAVSGFLVLTNDYGSFGIAISRMIGFTTIFLSVFYVEKWFFGKIQILFWSKIVGILAVSALFAAVVEVLVINYLAISWLTFILSTFCGGIVYCLFVWIMGFITDDEKLLITNILRRSGINK